MASTTFNLELSWNAELSPADPVGPDVSALERRVGVAPPSRRDDSLIQDEVLDGISLRRARRPRRNGVTLEGMDDEGNEPPIGCGKPDDGRVDERLEPEDSELTRTLYGKHSKELLKFFRVSRKMSVNDAGELLHRTFMALMETLRRRPKVEIRSPRAFLFCLAKAQLSTWFKQKGRETSVEFGPDDEEHGVEVETDDQELLQSMRSDQRMLLRALRKIDQDDFAENPRGVARRASERGEIGCYQMVLYLRFWVELTLEDTALVLKLPVGTVSARQRRGCKLLRRRIDQQAEREPEAHRTSTAEIERWKAVLEREAIWEQRDLVEQRAHRLASNPDADANQVKISGEGEPDESD